MTHNEAQWGPWVLQGTDLVIHPGEIAEYPVDLLTCTDSAQVLDWICQIAGRFGADRNHGPTEVGWFVLAVDDILHPQASLCSGGRSKTMTREAIEVACRDARRALLPDFRTSQPDGG